MMNETIGEGWREAITQLRDMLDRIIEHQVVIGFGTTKLRIDGIVISIPVRNRATETPPCPVPPLPFVKWVEPCVSKARKESYMLENSWSRQYLVVNS